MGDTYQECQTCGRLIDSDLPNVCECETMTNMTTNWTCPDCGKVANSKHACYTTDEVKERETADIAIRKWRPALGASFGCAFVDGWLARARLDKSAEVMALLERAVTIMHACEQKKWLADYAKLKGDGRCCDGNGGDAASV